MVQQVAPTDFDFEHYDFKIWEAIERYEAQQPSDEFGLRPVDI
jgi:hypothetical protein